MIENKKFVFVGNILPIIFCIDIINTIKIHRFKDYGKHIFMNNMIRDGMEPYSIFCNLFKVLQDESNLINFSYT